MKKVYFATPVNGRNESSFQEKKIAALKRCIEMREWIKECHPDWIITFSFTVCPINQNMDETEAMRRCLQLVRHCDIIVLDRRWRLSSGCCEERLEAKHRGIMILELRDALNPKIIKTK